MNHPRAPVQFLKNIIQLPVDEKRRFHIITSVLNAEIKTDEAEKPFYGLLFCLGSYTSHDKAKKKILELIKTTGYSNFFIAEYGKAIPLIDDLSNVSTEKLNYYVEENRYMLESQIEKEEKRLYEQRMKREEEILTDQHKEKDPETIEYAIRQCYLQVKNRSEYEYHQKMAAESKKKYDMRQEAAEAAFTKHPEYRQEWLPHLKQRLQHYGEEELYSSIERGFTALQENPVQ